MQQRSVGWHGRAWLSGLIAVLLTAGCLPAPGRVSPTAINNKEGTLKTSLLPGSVGPAGVGARVGAGAVTGAQAVAAPIISNNGANVLKGSVRVPASIISHNGGNIVSNNGGTIISHNGGNIISHNGGNIISHNGGNVRISQVPLAFTTVRLKDAASAPVKDAQGQELVTKTDANGNYAFPVDVKGRNLVIEADVEGQAGKLKSLLPKEGLQAGKGLDVDLTSTLTLAYILEQYVKGDLATFERLPKDIEAKARVVTEEAIVEKQIELPKTLEAGAIVAKVDEVRRAAPKVDTIFEEIKALLLLVGVRNEGDGMPATSVRTGVIGGLASDEAGNTFVFSPGYHVLWKVTPDGIAHTLVAKGGWGYQEHEIKFITPGYNSGLAVTPEGDVYLSDTYNNRIVKVSPARTVEVIAGNGSVGFAGDGGPAKNAIFNRPSGLARDVAGNLYVSDTENHRVRCIGQDGVIRTVAGDGTPGATGDGNLGVSARLNRPQGLTFGRDGELYIADNGNDSIRVLKDSRIRSLETNGAMIPSPMALAMDAENGLMVMCHYASRGLLIKQGEVNDLIDFATTFDGEAEFKLSFPRAIGASSHGVLVDTGQEVVARRVSQSELRSVVGKLPLTANQSIAFRFANSIAVDKNERIFVADMIAKKVFEVFANGAIEAIAGNGQDPDKLVSQSSLDTGVGMVAGLAIGNDGELIFSNFGLFPTVKSLDITMGSVKTVAGNGKIDYLKPAVGPAQSVSLGTPNEIARLNDGRVVFADYTAPGLMAVGTDGNVDYLVPPSDVGRVSSVALNSKGELVYVDADNARIMLFEQGLGKSKVLYSNEAVSAVMHVSDIRAISLDDKNRLYFASKNKVARIDEGNSVRLIAGIGAPVLNGTSRDEGLDTIRDITVSPGGHLYVLEEDRLKRIHKEQLVSF